jgi:N-acetylneuraminic acid mutarotase
MKRRRRVWDIGRLASLGLMATMVLAIPAAAQNWVSAGNLTLARIAAKAVLLDDGRVLVTGGNTNVGNTYDTKLAELYDPSTNMWSPTGSTANGRTDHTATRLADGRVLVAGGENANICTNDVTTELYDPATGSWSFSGNANVARTGATATLLNNGMVLLAGGGNRCGTVFDSAELYDPATGMWTPTGSMTMGRQWQSAVRLADGRVLVAGGQTPSPFPAVSSAEIYDPATGMWTATGSMALARCCGGNSFITRLSDGRVLAAGGYSGFANFVTPNGPAAETYDPATGLWTPTGPMSVGRGGGSLSLLGNGMVLAVGGTDGIAPGSHSSAELWDPDTGLWSLTASLAEGRAFHTSTVLANGKVVAASGYDVGTGTYLTSAELYEPFEPQHYTGYDLSEPERFIESVTLVDQFGEQRVRVEEAEVLLVPAEKRRTGREPEPIVDEDAHLVCHGIGFLPATERTVTVRNQFTEGSRLTTGRATMLCVPASKSLEGPAAAPPDDLDHYLCYDVRAEAPRFTSETLGVTDQFGARTARIDRARELCNPVEKRRDGRPAEPILHPDEHLVCYRITSFSPGFAARTVATNDQFGADTTRVETLRRLCVPSTKDEGGGGA